jgi:bifunctional UDP-N-acetylglucosamine pyrophosphorylase/glucosamine-1-phosphate N-acetyltransferase/UDP-N-acetylglucosamine pyrophosphorylase
MDKRVAVVILAAGLGKRMKSPKAKVLHEVLGKPMVVHVVETARAIAGDAVVVVVGNQAEEVRQEVSREAQVVFAHQEQQLGTGHAVMCALPWLPDECEQVVVLCGDVPLVAKTTLKAMIADHVAAGRDATLLAVELDRPFGYGRVLLDDRHMVRGIVEEADATDAQRAVTTINSGIYCIRRRFLADVLPRLTRGNAQGEFYFTDIVRIGYEMGCAIGMRRGNDPQEILGINTPEDLVRVEEIMHARRASRA